MSGSAEPNRSPPPQQPPQQPPPRPPSVPVLLDYGRAAPGSWAEGAVGFAGLAFLTITSVGVTHEVLTQDGESFACCAIPILAVVIAAVGSASLVATVAIRKASEGRASTRDPGVFALTGLACGLGACAFVYALEVDSFGSPVEAFIFFSPLVGASALAGVWLSPAARRRG